MTVWSVVLADPQPLNPAVWKIADDDELHSRTQARRADRDFRRSGTR
jgi:hypothetical protein